MQRLGIWEWLIVVALAAALAWRFWPKSWPLLPRARFSLRWLMVAVLVIGLICGGIARWYARKAQRQALFAELRAQQQVTNSAIQQAHVDLRALGRKNFSFLTENSFSLDEWTEHLDAYESPDGLRTPLINVEVSGGRDNDLLRPIIIKTTGGSQEGLLLDRLIRAYRARGWPHEVVPLSPADKSGVSRTGTGGS